MLRVRRCSLVALVAAIVLAGEARAERLTFVSINVLHGGVTSGLVGDGNDLEERLPLLAEGLRGLDPDVIGVQEASTSRGRGNTAARLAAALGFTYVYAPASFRLTGWAPADGAIAAMMNFSEGPAILSRFPIASSEVRALPRCNGFFDVRVALRAELATPSGPLQVFSTHLSWGACESGALLEIVRERPSGGPAVVMGDFNAVEDSPAIASLSGAAGWVDVFRALHPTAPGLTVWQDPGAARSTVQRRVDYVLLVPGEGSAARPIASRVVLDRPGRAAGGGVLWLSDHYGVLAEIDFAPESRE